MAGFNMRDYNTVDSRLVEFFKKFPNGSVEQHSLEFLRDFGGKDWIVYTAAAYRTPDDPKPGMGTAWEQVPGTTPFTKDSELQNAETAAWGRALVAANGATARNGVASREEVQTRAATNAAPEFIPSDAANELMGRVRAAETLEDLSTVWKSIQSGKEIGAVSDHEYAVLKQQVNSLKRELEVQE